jgi:hypothetical protein
MRLVPYDRGSVCRATRAPRHPDERCAMRHVVLLRVGEARYIISHLLSVVC